MGYEKVLERSPACPEDCLGLSPSLPLFALHFMYTVALNLAVGVGSLYWYGLLSTSRWKSLTQRYDLLGPSLWEQEVLSPHYPYDTYALCCSPSSVSEQWSRLVKSHPQHGPGWHSSIEVDMVEKSELYVSHVILPLSSTPSYKMIILFKNSFGLKKACFVKEENQNGYLR